MPRLIVAHSNGVSIWNNVNMVSSDTAPDAVLSVSGTPLRLAIYDDNLLIATNNASFPLARYAGAGALGDGATATDSVPVAEFDDTPLFSVYDLEADTAGNLWICDGNIRMFSDADTLGAGSASRAQFTHVWGPQIYGVEYDTNTSLLYGGQVSGDGIIVWDSPLGATGEDNLSDWQLSGGMNPTALQIAGGRLYVSSITAGNNVSIWNNIASAASATAPDIILDINNDLTDSNDLFVRDDVLVVTNNDAPNNYSVALFTGLSTINSASMPAAIATDSLMVLPKKSLYGRIDALYVMDSNGILIFDRATMSPMFRTQLTSGLGNLRDMLLLECSPTWPCSGSETCVNGMCQ